MSCRRIAGMCLVLATVSAVGCSRASVKIDGSSTVLPISEAVVEKSRDEGLGVNAIVSRSGTGGGFKKFSNGEIDICNASRPITDVEKKACAEKGVEFLPFEIAFDGLAVCVNSKNTWCDCLTVEQLKAVWQPESAVSKWSDLDPEWPAEEIKLYGAGTDSGTFDYFTEAIVGEAKKEPRRFHAKRGRQRPGDGRRGRHLFLGLLRTGVLPGER
jgi:phosphate transport system substrate-binding protein